MRVFLLLVLCTGLLGGCADRPLGPHVPLADAMIDGGVVKGEGGAALAVSTWPSQGATRAVILALHGYGDHGRLTYDAAARAWAERGIAVYAMDQRGFGHNDSYRRWPGAERLSADAVAVSRVLRTQHPNRPLVVIGHSMGGGVALAAAGEGLEADALVLAGPAIAGGAEVNPFYRIGGGTMAALIPDKRFTGRGIVRIRASDNDAALRKAGRDPRHIGNPSGRELFGLLSVMDRAAAAAPNVTTPTLTLMGAKDQVLRPTAIRRVHNRIPGRVEYRLYDDGWHWLFRDLQAERVWDDVADFVLSLPD